MHWRGSGKANVSRHAGRQAYSQFDVDPWGVQFALTGSHSLVQEELTHFRSSACCGFMRVWWSPGESSSGRIPGSPLVVRTAPPKWTRIAEHLSGIYLRFIPIVSLVNPLVLENLIALLLCQQCCTALTIFCALKHCLGEISRELM